MAARAWEREVAPESPIPFTLKFKLVKEELVARAWEREVAPESPILLTQIQTSERGVDCKSLGKGSSARIKNPVPT